MTKKWVQHIGDDQLVYGMPKHMSAVAGERIKIESRFTVSEADKEKLRQFRKFASGENSYWTVHPKPNACDKCQSMAGVKFEEKPERPHPNCKCEIKKHKGKAEERLDCSHLISVVLPGVGATTLDKDFAQRVQAWRALNAKSGINLTFNEGFRTTKEQKDLEDTKDGLAAKAGTSLHEAGRAVDAKVSRWKKKDFWSKLLRMRKQ